MTTHVFIVNSTTFPYHLEYLFVGTGAQNKDVDFNNTPLSSLYPWTKHAAESGLVAMMADCSRVRNGDLILFYLQASGFNEGKFYGVFKVTSDPFLDRVDNPQFLLPKLGKNLTFRIKIKPFQVFSEGVTEWKALDEIRHIMHPCQMIWSLIYRKLKGNRGNTMITIYESERLLDLIRRENNNKPLPISPCYTYKAGKIVCAETVSQYKGTMTPFNILPRLAQRFTLGKSHEAHLQMYITQNIAKNTNLDNALGISGKTIEWIGNEVSCGVGMQRIDVMISMIEDEVQRVVMPIELKAVPVSVDNLYQLSRYIDWIEQYYIPNRMSTIQPVLICKEGGLSSELQDAFRSFNNSSQGRYLSLRYIEYTVSGDPAKNPSISFRNLSY